MAKKALTPTLIKKPTSKPQTKVIPEGESVTNPSASYKVRLERDAEQAKLALTDNGSGGARKSIPFRPYEETRLAMVRLATDLSEQRGELVKVHDIMIEAMNDYFKKHHVDHIAKRPTRAKK